MRTFVPFGDPWQMPIDVPYSFLVRDEDLAWICGQLAIDMEAHVLASGDLIIQTEIVCDYIETILARGGTGPEALGKLVLYFVESAVDDAELMMACCRSRFGERVVLVPVAVPHFYFPGMMLEGGGSDTALVGEITYAKETVLAQSFQAGGTHVTTRRSGRLAWFSGRSTDGDLGLVPQTTQLMKALADALQSEGLDFGSVVKSTSLYVGGSSDEELYGNQSIRNGYYEIPGPASTGLPVSRFADPNSLINVDVLAVTEA